MSRLEFPSDAIVVEDLPSGTEATVPMTASILKGRRKSWRNYLGFGKWERAHEEDPMARSEHISHPYQDRT